MIVKELINILSQYYDESMEIKIMNGDCEDIIIDIFESNGIVLIQHMGDINEEV